MSTLQLALVGILAVGSADTPDVEKYKDLIVGTWEMTKVDGKDPGVKFAMEFTKDGKIKVFGSVHAAYSVKGDTLTITTTSPDGKKQLEDSTILKLDDKEMHRKGKDGKVVEYKKVQ